MTPTLRLAITCSYAIPTTIHGGPKPLDLPATTGESPTSLPSPRPSQQRCPCRRAGSSSAQPPLPAAPGPNASCPLRPEARTTAPGHTPPAAPPLARAQPMHVRGSGSPTPPALSSLRSPRYLRRTGPKSSTRPAGLCSGFASPGRPAAAPARPRARHGEAEAGPARYLPAARGRRAAGPARPPAPREQAAPPPRAGPSRSATPAPEPLRPLPFAGPPKPRSRGGPRPRYLSAKERRRPPAFGRRAARLGPGPALDRLGGARVGLRPGPPCAGRRRPRSPRARALRAPPAAPTCWEPPSRRPPPGPPSPPPTSRSRGRGPAPGPPPALPIG